MNHRLPHDRFDLARFVSAQQPVYADVLAELRAGRKRTHWMWFVFPQLASLGRSAMAQHYGLSGLEEARAYLAHPLLGARLRECVAVLLALTRPRADMEPGQAPPADATAVFGDVDAMKLRSCMTLFMQAGGGPDFEAVLGRWFGAEPDTLTLRMLQARPA